MIRLQDSRSPFIQQPLITNTETLFLSATDQTPTQGLTPSLPPLGLCPYIILIQRARVASLRSIHALFTRRITDAAQQATAAQLPADSLRQTVLDGTDVFVAGNIGLFELLCW